MELGIEGWSNAPSSYDTLTAGLAKNLEGDIYVEGKTYFKPTATVENSDGTFTSEEVGSGPASIETIQGNTVVWNQLNPNSMVSGTYTGTSLIQVQMLANYGGPRVFYFSAICSVDSGTDRMWIACKNSSNNYAEPSSSYYGQTPVKRGILYKCYPLDGKFYFRLSQGGSTSRTVTWTNCKIFDLTLMFGYGNEPETAEEFEDWLSKNVGLAPYYAYNAGTLANVPFNSI